MGRDKAMLPFRGGPLAEAIGRAVEEAAGCVVLVGTPERYSALPWPAIPDLYPGEGPLGGLLTALVHTSADWNVMVACDMPGVSAAFLREMLTVAQASDADILAPCPAPGKPEPLCAIYHARVRSAMEKAFARGVRKVSAAWEGLQVVNWLVPEISHFRNINTPEDWTAYARE
jgi:molybdopterin-guanine dinucleotide biosynthesis protein A